MISREFFRVHSDLSRITHEKGRCPGLSTPRHGANRAGETSHLAATHGMPFSPAAPEQLDRR